MHRPAFVLAALLALSISGTADARGDLDPADIRALRDYPLSMNKVKAMQDAMDEAKKLHAMDPNKHLDDNAKTLAQMEAKLNAMPQAAAIFRRHGLTAHDVVVMPLALMDAGVAVSYPKAAASLSDRVSPAQIAFYKQHMAELKKMPWLFGDSGD